MKTTSQVTGSFFKTKQKYLDFLSVHIQDLLAEVHPDGGLYSPGELGAAEPVCEAGLAHPGVSDHQHLEGPAAAQQAGGHGAAQGAGELQGGLHLAHGVGRAEEDPDRASAARASSIRGGVSE